MAPKELLIGKHIDHILSLESKSEESTELYFTDHKRLSGVFWAVTSLALVNSLHRISKSKIIEYTLSCYHGKIGAFGGNTNQDPHLLYTASGIQVLSLYDALDQVDCDAVGHYVAQLQQDDGSFVGDDWGEKDLRFSYCAILVLRIIGCVSWIKQEKAVQFIKSCINFDGGFGCLPGAESHAGHTLCGVGALALLGKLDVLNVDTLGRWLCERQLPCGGFNGRPDKLEDVCYSWWVLSSLSMIGRMSWIDGKCLRQFILACQDENEGGIADRPGDVPDVFHTFFGIAGLSLLGNPDLAKIDPRFALPVEVVARLKHSKRDEKSSR